MNPRFLLPVLSLLALVVPTRSRAEEVSVDVFAWTNGVETADGWEVTGVTRYVEPGGVKFGLTNSRAASPNYDGCITQIVAEVCCGSADPSNFLVFVPGSPSDAEARTAVPTKAYTEQVFSWRPSDAVRGINVMTTGSGNRYWGIRRLVIYLDRISAPGGIGCSARYANTLDVEIEPVADAASYELEVRSLTRIAEAGETIRCWDFSVLTNTSGNTVNMTAQKLSAWPDLADVVGSNLCLQAHAGGHLQIGKSDVVGELALPVPVTETDLAFTARVLRHPKDDNDGEVRVVSGRAGELTDLGGMFLTTEPADFAFALPAAAETVGVRSLSSRRVRIVRAALVRGYRPGSVVTNEPVVVTLRDPVGKVRGIPSGDLLLRARSVGADGRISTWSDTVPFRLSPALPRKGLAVFVR